MDNKLTLPATIELGSIKYWIIIALNSYSHTAAQLKTVLVARGHNVNERDVKQNLKEMREDGLAFGKVIRKEVVWNLTAQGRL